MHCHEVHELFSGYFDDYLSDEERASVVTHLEACPSCLEEWERFQKTVAVVGSLGEIQAPSGLAARVLERVQRQPWPSRVLEWLLFPLHIKLPLEAMALLLIALGAVFLYKGSPDLQKAAQAPVPLRAEAPLASGKPGAAPVPKRVETGRQAQRAKRAAKPASQLEPEVPAQAETEQPQLEEEAVRPGPEPKALSGPQGLKAEAPLETPQAQKEADEARFAPEPPGFVGRTIPPLIVPRKRMPTELRVDVVERMFRGITPVERFGLAAQRAAEPSFDAVITVWVEDVSTSESQLREQIGRIGGKELREVGLQPRRSRTQEGVAVSILLFQLSYPSLKAFLTELGKLRVEQEAFQGGRLKDILKVSVKLIPSTSYLP